MKRNFIKTTNVKNFIGLVENLLNKPENIPKMGLIYGEPGLGKSQTALWLACKYDAIYLRATNFELYPKKWTQKSCECGIKRKGTKNGKIYKRRKRTIGTKSKYTSSSVKSSLVCKRI